MNNIASLIAEVQQAWLTSGATLRPGVEDVRILEFEQRYGVRMPGELAEYFRAVDGMLDGDSDTHLIRFWTLAEMRPVALELPRADQSAYDGYFVLADYSLWAHAYAIRLSAGDNDVAIVGGDAPIQIASSFSNFLLIYLRQPELLFK